MSSSDATANAVSTLESREQYDRLIADNKTVLVDFYADWCGPCKQMDPILESLAESVDVPVVSVDIEEHTDLAKDANVQSIPTLLVFEDGTEVDRFVGVTDEATLRSSIA